MAYALAGRAAAFAGDQQGEILALLVDEGRHLFTNEVAERLKINLPLLESGVGAVSYFVKQLEQVCKLRGTHAALSPLVQTFLEEILFVKKTNLYDQPLVSRLADSDVGEHLRGLCSPDTRPHHDGAKACP